MTRRLFLSSALAPLLGDSRIVADKHSIIETILLAYDSPQGKRLVPTQVGRYWLTADDGTVAEVDVRTFDRARIGERIRLPWGSWRPSIK